jgi:hypothetical protein
MPWINIIIIINIALNCKAASAAPTEATNQDRDLTIAVPALLPFVYPFHWKLGAARTESSTRDDSSGPDQRVLWRPPWAPIQGLCVNSGHGADLARRVHHRVGCGRERRADCLHGHPVGYQPPDQLHWPGCPIGCRREPWHAMFFEPPFFSLAARIPAGPAAASYRVVVPVDKHALL